MGGISVENVRVEGHEQFAIRGVSAGVFVVQEHAATAHHFDLRLEVDGVMRSWAVPKGPSLDPAAKRLAVQVEDHGMAHNDFEGPTGHGGVIVWDRGSYEQGGRVAWPEAIERGHAVFVLHGEKLNGGFALQRTRPGEKPQWLLIKRKDEQARPGSNIVAERPDSVLSSRTLQQLIGVERLTPRAASSAQLLSSPAPRVHHGLQPAIQRSRRPYFDQPHPHGVHQATDDLEGRTHLSRLDPREGLARDPAPARQICPREAPLLTHHAERGRQLGVGAA